MERVQFSVPSNDSRDLELYVNFTNTFSSSDARNQKMGFNFNPQFTVNINQDRGALLGTIAMVRILSSALPACSGVTGTHYYGDFRNMQGDVGLIQMNGGRPF